MSDHELLRGDAVLPAGAAAWLADGRRVAVATLIGRDGSAPLSPGASMVIDGEGRIEGNLTGGCVESAVVQEAADVLAGGAPRLLRYGIADDEAMAVGLTCGGTVHVLVAEAGVPVRAALARALGEVQAGRPVALATLLDGPHAGLRVAVTPEDAEGGLGDDRLDHTVVRDARGLLAQGVSTIRSYGSEGETVGYSLRVYVHSFGAPPQVVILGATDFSVAVARLARELGFRVTIVDAREQFARSPRFRATGAEVLIGWPDVAFAGRELGPQDAVLVFTHDPKFDEPGLQHALRSGAGYIGALGSRRTQAARRQRLLDLGVSPADLARIWGPCGLDIGARTPAETAVSVLAEVIAVRAGRTGGSLRRNDAPIHDQ